MNTKKNVLIVSAIYVIFSIAIFLTGEFCNKTWCRVHDDDPLGLFFFFFLPLLPIFLLSLITYKMRDEVFRAWWRFARWWASVIVAVTLLLERAGGGGGIGIGGAVSTAFDILVLGVLYTVLVVVSLIQIAQAYFRAK